MKFLLLSCAALGSASLSRAQLSLDSGTFMDAPDESIDISSIVQVQSDYGVTMCAAASVEPSTTVYYGPCRTNVDYAGTSQAPPLGYVKQTVEVMKLLTGGASGYLSAVEGVDDDDDDDGHGYLRTSGAPYMTTAGAIGTHAPAMTTMAAITNTNADPVTTEALDSYIVHDIGPALCGSDADYVAAVGTQEPGGATVATSLLGLSTVSDDCSSDQKAWIGTATYLVLDGSFEAEYNRIPFGTNAVEVKIADSPRSFGTGAYKFALFGAFYGADWEEISDDVTNIGVRVSLTQMGCDPDDGCAWSTLFESGNSGVFEAAGDDNVVEDVTRAQITMTRNEHTLTQTYNFDTTYRYGNVTITDGEMSVTDEGEDDCQVNVVVAGDGVLYMDVVIPFDHLRDPYSYFIYDPSVEATESTTTTPTTTTAADATTTAPDGTTTAAPGTTAASTTAAPGTTTAATAASTTAAPGTTAASTTAAPGTTTAAPGTTTAAPGTAAASTTAASGTTAGSGFSSASATTVSALACAVASVLLAL